METTALTDNKLVMYTSEQVQQMLDMVVRSLSRQGLNNAPVNLDNVHKPGYAIGRQDYTYRHRSS